MHAKKPDPLLIREGKALRICDVCGEVSYSAAGMHPQCAQQQADERRIATIKAEKQAAAQNPAAVPAVSKPWSKPCPKCQRSMHIRKRQCDCGFIFR
jgi:hypothetical protein